MLYVMYYKQIIKAIIAVIYMLARDKFKEGILGKLNFFRGKIYNLVLTI